METGKYVLVVEDDHDAAEVTATVLEWLGHRCRVVHTAGDALRALHEHEPAIVLLDLGLPDGPGADVARALRQRPGGEAVAVIATTGFSDEARFREAVDAGVDDILIKPLTIAMVADALARVRRPVAA